MSNQHDAGSDTEVSNNLSQQQQQHQSSNAPQQSSITSQSQQQQPAIEEDVYRPSLLDVVIDEFNQEKHARTARMVLIGEIDSEKVPLLQKFHADFLDSLDMKESTDRMTGTLLVLNSCCFIELVEAPTKVLVQLMRNLAEVSGWNVKSMMLAKANLHSAGFPAGGAIDQQTPSSSMITVDSRHHPLLRSSAILSFTEEIPREYHIWAFRSLRLPNTQDEINITQLMKDPLKSVFDTTKNLIDIARDLQGMNEEKAIDYIQTSITRQLTTKIPTSEKLLAYLHHLSQDHLCNLEEWLEIYDTPIEFTLENEKVWPVEPFLKY